MFNTGKRVNYTNCCHCCRTVKEGGGRATLGIGWDPPRLLWVWTVGCEGTITSSVLCLGISQTDNPGQAGKAWRRVVGQSTGAPLLLFLFLPLFPWRSGWISVRLNHNAAFQSKWLVGICQSRGRRWNVPGVDQLPPVRRAVGCMTNVGPVEKEKMRWSWRNEWRTRVH